VTTDHGPANECVKKTRRFTAENAEFAENP
jgi:hypothetical protein